LLLRGAERKPVCPLDLITPPINVPGTPPGFGEGSSEGRWARSSGEGLRPYCRPARTGSAPVKVRRRGLCKDIKRLWQSEVRVAPGGEGQGTLPKPARSQVWVGPCWGLGRFALQPQVRVGPAKGLGRGGPV